MTPTGTFDRVYGAIKQRLRAGGYRPGSRLEPATLSDELNASVTPVRDALHRLTGERIVEAPRHEGFRVPMMTEPTLRQLYQWHLDLLLLALMKRRAIAILEEEANASDPIENHRRQNALFIALVRSAGNAEHLAALQSLSHRLEPVQRLEDMFLTETESETAEILEALKKRDLKTLKRSLVRYHRRRQKIVPDLLAKLLET